MSIYATLWHIRIPCDGVYALTEDEWVDVWAQAVPPHIGHPSHYPDGDPYAAFLPPVVAYDDDGDELINRAVVICGPLTTKGTDRHHQEYENPLFVLTGEEYQRLHWDDLYERIAETVRQRLGITGPSTIGVRPDGTYGRLVPYPRPDTLFIHTVLCRVSAERKTLLLH